jgi:hypothetical protein
MHAVVGGRRGYVRSTMPIVRPDDIAFLQTTHRAILATIAPNGQPRQVPICFAIVDSGDRAIVYSPLDEKPKRGSDPHQLA